jgi:hypothetical protein
VSRSPRSERARVYQRFCELMGRRPGELNLSREKDFSALVGQFFIGPGRREHFAKLQPVIGAWDAEVDKQVKKRSYVKRKRRSVTDDLWKLLGRLYWNHAAWIILRGEYKALKKKRLSDREIEKQLKGYYCYLSQLKRQGWFAEVERGGSPLNLAYRDTAESFKQPGLDGESLRRMLLPGRLRKSPPAPLVTTYLAYVDSKKLLAKLKRIPPSRRTHKDRVLIRAIESEAD